MHKSSNTAASEQPSNGHTFGMVQKDIARDRSLPPHVKQVYTALTLYADAARKCFPSQATLAADTGLSERTVNKAIKQGKEAGLWEVVHTQTSNHYQLRDFGRGYVVGSGPLRTTCGLEPQEMRSGPAQDADEQDQRTRPADETSPTSSDAYAAGAPRTSSRGQRIQIFVPATYWTADAGECSRLLTRSSVKALEVNGYEADADEIGHAVKAAIEASGEKGIDREVLRRQLENTLNLAAGRDPSWARLIRWDPWESAA